MVPVDSTTQQEDWKAMDMQQAAIRATNTGLYQSVDDALPQVLPAITREEAQRANELLCRHFGKVSLAFCGVAMLWPAVGLLFWL